MKTLTAEEIGKSYGGREVVRGVSLSIEQGEVVGLLGPNGAGKTTSFYMIVGLVRPDAGRILADGHDISRLPMYLRARNYGISYLPQEPSVFRKLTVEDNILAVLEAQELSWEQRRTRTERLIEQLNLGHVRKTKGYALSGGERRRVEIARCLAIEPAFILLDEPFSGIDPIAVLDLQEIIFGLKRSGIGVLITDHNVREDAFCDGSRLHHCRGKDLSTRHSRRVGTRCRGASHLSGREVLNGLVCTFAG